MTNFANFVHERPFILLIPAKGNPIFLMPKLEEPHVRIRSVGELEYLHYFEFPAPKSQEWFDKMQEVLQPNHRVGVESVSPLQVVEAVPGTAVRSEIVEVERTFFLGHVPEAAERPFHDMVAARALAYELTKPGNSMSEVDDRQVNELLKSRGYADNLLHRTGHGFGVTSHEAPFLAEGYDREIKPGMVFSIEPDIYLPGTGGFRFSDTLLITETDNQKLTHAPESLEDLTLDSSISFRDALRSWTAVASEINVTLNPRSAAIRVDADTQ